MVEETEVNLLARETVQKRSVEPADEEPETKRLKVVYTLHSSVNTGSLENESSERAAVNTDGVKAEEKGEDKQRGKKGKSRQPKPQNKPGKAQGDWKPRENAPESSGPKLPKRKVALLMGYCGTGYNGMQINPGVETLESELHKALAASGAVSKDNAFDPAKINFMRAARTDKGVHAAGQVCSLKMIIEDPDIVTKINQHLPEQIRVWGYVRTSNSFHAKNACDSRIYEYFLPTYVLHTVAAERYPLSVVAKKSGRDLAPLASEHIDLPKPSPEELAKRREFRISPSQLALLRSILLQFIGTNNCYNFTVNKPFHDKSANRYIMNFEASEPIIRGGIEWVKCTVHGQSFMLHQIRKMIGLAILMVRTEAPVTLVKQAFENVKLNIPKAPALGLLLERTVYRMYNDKWANEAQERLEPVDFDKYKDTIDDFKEKWIYSRLIAEELETAQFDEWNRIIDSRSIDYAWFLTADGVLADQKPESIGKKPLDAVRGLSADIVEDAGEKGGDE